MDKPSELVIKLSTPLRSSFAGKPSVKAQGSNIRELIQDLESQFPGSSGRLLDMQGNPQRFIRIYLNNEEIKYLDGVKTSVRANDVVSILQAVAGG